MMRQAGSVSCPLWLIQCSDHIFLNNRTIIQSTWTRILGKAYSAHTSKMLTAIMPPVELDQYGFNSLHQTILGLKSIPVEEISERSPSMIDEEDSDGRTALSWAAQRRDSEVMKVLLRNKTDTHKLDCQKRSPMFWALIGGSPQCIQLLLDCGTDINQVDSFGDMPLFQLAFLRENVDLLNVLLKQTTNINFQSRDGDSFLLAYLQNRKFRIVRKLIHYGANIHLKESSGYNALSVAVLYNAHPIIRLLLEREADHQGVIKQQGSFLHLIARMADLETVKMLTNPGSKLATRYIHTKDNDGRTPLMVAESRADLTLEWHTAFRSFLWSVDAEKVRVSPVYGPIFGNDAHGVGDSDEEDNFVDASE